jgi:recombination protein RecT
MNATTGAASATATWKTTTMSESVGQEVARVSAPYALIEASKAEFGKLLPASIGPEKFARWGLTVLRNGLASPVPSQRESWARVIDSEEGKLSLMTALMDCASLGLEPGRTYHLVPFRNKQGGAEVTGITDYKGEIELIGNAGGIVIAELVREKDQFYWRGASTIPDHMFEPFDDDRGDVIGGYAYLINPGGSLASKVVHMSAAEFAKHAAASKTAGRDDSPWKLWRESMQLKTLVHELRKWVPWAVERQA